MVFKERERRWQHREETMATNREREAERDLDGREKQIRDWEIMARKLVEWDDDIEDDRDQEEYHKNRDLVGGSIDNSSEHTLEEESEEAMEAELNNEKEILTLAAVGASQNNSVKLKLTLNLASKRRAALMELAEDEESDDEEGIESKRKRRVLVPLKYSDNEDDENKAEERKKN
ncbi:hypothetical protein C1646_799893 [Rhizophagus diaphanus]|nr:hypothetical protein C1646_799893 [Rhizophagus diaphanus] [Rhizophagus sp. MUCL 43196]